jgi:hypothetical protein
MVLNFVLYSHLVTAVSEAKMHGHGVISELTARRRTLNKCLYLRFVRVWRNLFL